MLGEKLLFWNLGDVGWLVQDVSFGQFWFYLTVKDVKRKSSVVTDTQMWGFLSLFYVTVNWFFLGYILSVSQNKQSKDVSMGCIYLFSLFVYLYSDIS